MATEKWIEDNKDKMRQYRRDYYHRNKDNEKQRIINRKQEISLWFKEYKAVLACNRCGENHPACLDFHHSNPQEKDGNISTLVNSGWSIERILEEINKCEVLCSNCHRKHHNTNKGL